MTENKYVITWNQISGKTFMYGTEISFNDTVTFRNELMPSGTLIHEWVMRTNYQADRNIPSLPILKRKREYKIKFNIESTPENSVYFKILFYRRDESLIESIIFDTYDASFTFPEAAYFYKIALMSASVVSFEFVNIVISDKDYRRNHNIIRPTESVLNIIIKEPSPFNYGINDESIQHLNNVLVVAKDELNVIEDFVHRYQVNFIGYGEVSNLIACKLARQHNEIAFITSKPNNDSIIQYGEFPENELSIYKNQSSVLNKLTMQILEQR
ncbi:accessory Sec system protein Asp3 [Macrococcus epidermidis]|uniref:Accessory Sec system protein Asp3 n=1 Tax=Macrococcus epidermidis TaxID=1902580 RepID=A0A327ZMB3_9STAP|nr:accessory Sec system protein Asp3 [Macrococcus epidermidis]RAK43583.1 accessory Sec system protein Asp3 [Macrococcus epidermidis]